MSHGSMRAVKTGSSRQLAIVFLAVLVPAAVTLVWLGWRLLEQDRLLYAQREVERHEAASDAAVRALAQMLAETERRGSDGATAEGTAILRRVRSGVEILPRGMAAWVPTTDSGRDAPSNPFLDAESLEFRGDLQQALVAYERLVGSKNAPVRAGALMRSARVRRKLGRGVAAVADYSELAELRDITINGMAVDLVARRAVCQLLSEGGQRDALRLQAGGLERDLVAGRWELTRDAWELVATELSDWIERPVRPTSEQLGISKAAEWFVASSRLEPGAQVVRIDDVRLTMIVRAGGGEALVIAPSELDRWLSVLDTQQGGDGRAVTLVDGRGTPLAGAALVKGAPVVRRASSDTALPWGVIVARGAAQVPHEFRTRRRMFAAGLGALGLLLGGGSYLLWRVVQRELAVARLQAEFVSAVSHEFRTPVTSLRHVVELLQEDDEGSRERRTSFYDVLARSTDRLDRLVESLLDFGRMESGRKPYDLRPVDPAALVVTVAKEFERDPAARGYRLAVEIAPGIPGTISADETALGHAVWNLLDNAVKYSPEARDITISIVTHRKGLGIAVTDQGIGVPRSEHSDIFLKFVRAENALRLGIKGTGVGLAIVMHIVRAHGGTVEVHSQEGLGSTFRIVLPVAS